MTFLNKLYDFLADCLSHCVLCSAKIRFGFWIFVADGDIGAILKQLFEKANLNTLTTKEGSDLIKHLMGMRQKKTDEQPF